MAGIAPTQEVTLQAVEPEIFKGDLGLEEHITGKWGTLISVNGNTDHVDLVGNRKYIFGRGEDCDIVFSNPRISGNHLSIAPEIDEHRKFNIVLEDLSTNGTFHNGKKMGKNRKSLLYNGDEVSPLLFRSAAKKKKSIVYMFKDVLSQKKNDAEGGIHSTFDIKETLGTGNFSTVKLGFHKKSGKKYAIKEINKQYYAVISWKQGSLMNEVRVMEQIGHKNIVNIFEVYETEETLYIVMDFVGGGDLLSYLLKVKSISEFNAKNFFTQILDGLEYLHAQGICHRDIKPENILLSTSSEGATLKITDFGISRIVSANTLFMSTLVGTPMYLAPEVRSSPEGYTMAVDIWSLGCVLYNMLSGLMAFEDGSDVLTAELKFPQEIWKDISEDAIDLIENMLNVNPIERYTIEQIREHPWMSRTPKRTRSLDGDDNIDNIDKTERKRPKV